MPGQTPPPTPRPKTPPAPKKNCAQFFSENEWKIVPKNTSNTNN